MRGIILALACVAVLIVTSGQVQAGVIISNLPSNDMAGGGIDAGPPPTSAAAGFKMPIGRDFSLDAIVLRLNFLDLDSDPLLQLFGDLGGDPGGSPLLTLDNPMFAVGIDNFAFVPSSAFTLKADTTYWVVASNRGPLGSSFRWLASVPGVIPTGIATNAGYRFSAGVPPTSPTDRLSSYQVDASQISAVPEPASLAIFGIGVLGMAGTRRHRRRKQRA